MFPIPDKDVVNFCGDSNSAFVDTIAQDLRKVIIFALYALAAAAIIVRGALLSTSQARPNAVLFSACDRSRYSFLVGVQDSGDLRRISLPKLLPRGRPEPTSSLDLAAPGFLRSEQESCNLARSGTDFNFWCSHLVVRLASVSKAADPFYSINFITHPPVVTFFFIGALGCLVAEAQLLLLSGGLRSKGDDLVQGEFFAVPRGEGGC